MRQFQKLTKENTPILMAVLLGMRVLGTLLSFVNESFYFLYLAFDPSKIMRGQIWRLFTFVMYPAGSGIMGIILLALMTFVYFSIAQHLMMVFGKFKLNFFLILGLVLEVVLGFIYYLIMTAVPTLNEYAYNVLYLNPTYLYSMMFVLFAMMYPDMRFLLMFIIPIKGKWLVFVTLGLYLLEVAQAFFSIGVGYAWFLIAMIIAAIITVLAFLLFAKKNVVSGRSKKWDKQVKNARFKEMKADGTTREKRINPSGARHCCTICHRTEKTNPELEFRYCSKCVGDYEYCSDHLYTHLHKYPNVTDGAPKS